MKIDFGDIFATGIGYLLKQMVLLIAAIWAGSLIGAIALTAGSVAESGSLSAINPGILIASPSLLLSIWIFPNVFSLCVAVYAFARIDGNPYIFWGSLTIAEALVVVASNAGKFHGWLPVSVLWLTLAIVATMAGTALWFLRQWQLNRWAGELAMLRSENAMRGAEMTETYGTTSAGIDELDQV